MAPRQVLTISSQVAAGPVGNSAIVPALLAMGVTPVALPTVMLSNHPGHGAPEGLAMPADRLAAMLERLAALGFVREDAIVLTGYFASAGQIEAVAAVIARLPKVLYLCDPVLGDTPKGLYVREDVALAIRDRLVPLAHVLTPNAFELGWLTGRDVRDRETARAACRTLPGKSVVATSLREDGRIMTALFEGAAGAWVSRPKLPDVPNGTGDLLSGLIAARLALGLPLADSIGFAVAAVERVVALSAGAAGLDLAAGLDDIASVEDFAIVRD
ncbi:MAG: pyridoxal kinase [Parvibaculaceae bacterium]